MSSPGFSQVRVFLKSGFSAGPSPCFEVCPYLVTHLMCFNARDRIYI